MLKALLIALVLTGNAFAQDWYQAQLQASSAQVQQYVGNIVQNNMANPQLQALYRQYGGGYTFEQFCYLYGATGGFTQQGIQQYHNVSQGITAQQQQAWQGYQAAQAQRASAQSAYQNGYYVNQGEAGNILNGNMTYSTPNGAAVLPYNWNPGYYQSQQQNYYVNPAGQYYQVNGQGWATPIAPGY